MRRSHPPALPYVAVVLSACAWGTWAWVLRRTEAIAPMPAALESTIVMGVMIVVSFFTGRYDRGPGRVGWPAAIGVAWLGVSDAMNALLYFGALRINITVAVLVHYLAPVLVAVASPPLLRERLTARTVVAVVLSLLGLAVMLVTPTGPLPTEGLVRCALLAGASAFFYASNVIVNKWVAHAFSPSEAMFWHAVVATPFMALFVPMPAWRALDAHAATFLALASVGPGALAGMIFVWGLRRMPAAHASTLTLIEPVVAVTLGAAVFGEGLQLRTLVGGALILVGAIIVMTQKSVAPATRQDAVA